MDSETQPLLTDTQRDPPHVHDRAQHFCARCSSELESQQGYKDHRDHVKSRRNFLLILAILLSCLMFAFSVVVSVFSLSILQVFVTLWTAGTVISLGLLLYMGRRRESRHPLGRTNVQIHALCGLACSWIIFMPALLGENITLCQWGGLSCGFVTTIHVLAWLLIITRTSIQLV
ncbi:hypothetical protein B0H11DRAFT_1256819 [Mycena galericulata]|nr:hypothetical protein B0H11DRAFT_1256819 [Mycena galericulata]